MVIMPHPLAMSRRAFDRLRPLQITKLTTIQITHSLPSPIPIVHLVNLAQTKRCTQAVYLHVWGYLETTTFEILLLSRAPGVLFCRFCCSYEIRLNSYAV
jgi:hypothetical protein